MQALPAVVSSRWELCPALDSGGHSPGPSGGCSGWGGLDLIQGSLPGTVQWVGVLDLTQGSLPGTIQWVGGLDLTQGSLPGTIRRVQGWGVWT